MATKITHTGAIIRGARAVYKDKVLVPEDCYLTVLEGESEYQYTAEGFPPSFFAPYMGVFVNLELETRAFVYERRQIIVADGLRIAVDVQGMQARIKAAPGAANGTS